MTRTIDQMGRSVLLSTSPQRIISLVPSQTELLYSLGLGDRVVGITKFCIHPQDWFRSKTRVGGTKQVKFDKIAALEPDLIIGNKEENQKEDIETLEENYPVWMSDIYDTKDALAMILALGCLTQTEDQAQLICQRLTKDFEELQRLSSMNNRPKVAYFIWRKPYMLAANSTFINHMLALAGFGNSFAHLERYPMIDLEDLARANPDFIFLSSEPYPFREKHIEELQQICPNIPIELVDGELFSWYGSRMLEFKDYVLVLRNKFSL
ncbi:MAG: helical backbone metal receptor [Saprospiraceae bacterium]|nr:helical backbone metal receptor [Saprospiraceae bacterium]